MNDVLLVTGGGTGGHLFAGIAIADEWKRRYPRARVLFVGSRGGIEERLVPKANYPLELLDLGSLKSVGWKTRLKTALQLPFALWRAAAIVRRERPAAVIGVGGYASGPVVLVARLFSRAPTAILEQNAVPGLTNRLLARFAHAVYCAFPGIEGRFPPGKTSVTGNPVRAEMRPFPSAARRPFTVFVFGGSKGAVGINSLVLDAFAELGDLLPEIRWIHQTGELDHARVAEGYAKAGVSGRIEKFIHDMPACYAAASLVVCRAGSSTLAELAAVHRAAVLVPFPFATDNHQEKNARLFVDRGAAELLVQKRSTGADLARLIRAFFADPSRLDGMETAVAAFHAGDAPARIVASIAASIAAAGAAGRRGDA